MPFNPIRELKEIVERYLVKKVNLDFVFNERVLDADFWLAGGDVGFATIYSSEVAGPPFLQLRTGNVFADDAYLYGQNRFRSPNPWMTNFSQVVWEARLSIVNLTNVQLFFGLISAGNEALVYAEPNLDIAEFFVDTSIDNQLHARTYRGGPEEQTDGLGAIDSNYHTYRIVWVASSVRFYIDGVLVATHTAQVPAANCNTEFLVHTLEADIKRLRMEYVKIEVS